MIHPSRLSDEELLLQCEVRRQRRSGPGGQHRNKVETGIFIEHVPTKIRSEATEARSQARNRDLAIQRLRVQLAIGVRCNATLARYPSQLWRERCRHGQLTISDRHRDFAALLAEALDVLADQGWDAKTAADLLGCSMSQLVKLLKRSPGAFRQLNDHRQQAGLRELR